MEINILCVGKIKEEYLKDGINEYLKRISAYTKINIIEVNEAKIPNDPNEKEIQIAKIEEGKNLLKAIPNGKYVIALDLNKKEFKSEDFSTFLIKKIEEADSKLYFVIGGSYGLSDDVKNRANASITLSKMTFTHQMTRLIILEQIYRAFKIYKNEVYHK